MSQGASVAGEDLIDHRRPVGPRTLGQRAATADRLRESLESGGCCGTLTNLGLLVPDPHARLAAVDLGGEFAVDEVFQRGYGACTYVFGWSVEREPINAPELACFYGGFGNLTLRPDLASLVPVPGEPGSWWVMCDARWPDGSEVEVAPRSILRRQLEEAESLGLVPSIGLEHESTFYDQAGQPLTDHGIDYALGGADVMIPVLREVHTALDQAGLGVESARAECHPGQYETVLRHRDALAACDDALLQQVLTRRAAARCGVRTSYLAAEGPGLASSCHVHLSLADLEGRPLGASEATRGADSREPSELLGAFLAGILQAAGDLTPVWAPTINAYVRLRTGPFSPRVVRWGVDDRTAAVRLAGSGPNLRLECRFAGADAAPHGVVAALLAAGLSGVRESLAPPAAGEAVDELPITPWQSLDRLASSTLAKHLLGPDVVNHQAALFRAEIEAWCDAVTDWQRHRGELRT